jgi:hypothetical protein
VPFKLEEGIEAVCDSDQQMPNLAIDAQIIDFVVTEWQEHLPQ